MKCKELGLLLATLIMIRFGCLTTEEAGRDVAGEIRGRRISSFTGEIGLSSLTVVGFFGRSSSLGNETVISKEGESADMLFCISDYTQVVLFL